MVLSIGCQNQPTAPQEIAKDTEQVTAKMRRTITSNQTGTDGLWYTYWTNGGGSVSMDLNGSGNFAVRWSNCGNFVCGKGWSTGSSRTITWSSSGGAQFIGVYGWMTNPLVEYYIGRGGGSSRGSYTANGRSYTLYIQNMNGPNIQGNGNFQQYNANGSGGSPQNMGDHFNGWRNIGASVGNQNYQIVSIEGWNSSGSASANVGGGGGGGSTSTTTTSGGGGGGGSNSIVVRARGTNGSEHINLTVGGSQIGSWTLSTSMRNYSASTNNTGGINVVFDNDGTNRDVQVDYITVNGSTRQAENQGTNTAVWQNGSCGGSNSEWMHCNGYIGFGDVSGGGGGGGSTSTTTTSGGGGGGGNITYNLRARSTDGQGQVNLRIDNNTIATWTLGSSMSTYNASSYNTGGINVEFYNDATNRDVQIDYLSVNGSARQAENQSTNTGVWQNGSCGGSNSEWLHCNGYIGFGNTP